MKRLIGILLLAPLLLPLAAVPAAQASYGLPPERLVSLVHNAPNTGKMLPAQFDPYVTTYLLTVASWVSRVTLTPTTASPLSVVTVNGQPVASGQPSQVIQMTNDPQQVEIVVTAYDTSRVMIGQTVYTVFLQRRPSERRTRVSAGYIKEITIKDGIATISADLVTINWKQKNTNISTFTNDSTYVYKYDTDPNCLFYFGTKQNPIRSTNASHFADYYLSKGSNLYYLIYIEDKIVCVLPYGAD
ncbi:MAG TPA: cadherin-like beta sandwich domain-containing protein [Candidatus Limnocylindria bacterium]|nr:cadherin-like beta sandwich domain-containing protein [Candidatus Limnocylindria bacterium]